MEVQWMRNVEEILFFLTVQRTYETLKPIIYKDLATCTHVFVRNDTVRAPLTGKYDGPYEVLKRYEKIFQDKNASSHYCGIAGQAQARLHMQ
ncbi:unnamed protein product [Danaus chrysippus]|uniref:(African queen) hypothetical protein n=1 Tax=Danaus chrysippus TaxID=151541 RepID=A0A8J2W7F6_9NEOP|nr:unnamed protein product [Danaus chrysippus]